MSPRGPANCRPPPPVTTKKIECDGLSTGVLMKRAEMSALPALLRKAETRFGTRLKSARAEVRSLYHYRIRDHPNVVKLIACGYDFTHRNPIRSPRLMVEQPICSLQDLLATPETYRRPIFRRTRGTALCLDVASALDCLRRCGIVHGDLKPDNVLGLEIGSTPPDNLSWKLFCGPFCAVPCQNTGPLVAALVRQWLGPAYVPPVFSPY